MHLPFMLDKLISKINKHDTRRSSLKSRDDLFNQTKTFAIVGYMLAFTFFTLSLVSSISLDDQTRRANCAMKTKDAIVSVKDVERRDNDLDTFRMESRSGKVVYVNSDSPEEVGQPFCFLVTVDGP